MAATTEELLELHGRVRACTACPLHVSRTQAVPGYGPVTARIMAVGEGPGETEDREGRPFVGAAGRLLTQLLTQVGLDRRDIYITNVVKCRPPANRDPEPGEVEACSHFLDEQVQMLQPDVILVLGRHALGRLLPGAGSITRLHGQRVTRGDRVYVPLYHPAAALYNASLLDTLRDDMARVRAYLDETQARQSALTGDAGSEPEIAALTAPAASGPLPAGSPILAGRGAVPLASPVSAESSNSEPAAGPVSADPQLALFE